MKIQRVLPSASIVKKIILSLPIWNSRSRPARRAVVCCAVASDLVVNVCIQCLCSRCRSEVPRPAHLVREMVQSCDT